MKRQINTIKSIDEIFGFVGKFLIEKEGYWLIGQCIELPPSQSNGSKNKPSQWSLEVNKGTKTFENKFKLFDFFNGKFIQDEIPEELKALLPQTEQELIEASTNGQMTKEVVSTNGEEGPIKPDRIIPAMNSSFTLSTINNTEMKEVATMQLNALRGIKKGDQESMQFAKEINSGVKSLMDTVKTEVLVRKAGNLL